MRPDWSRTLSADLLAREQQYQTAEQRETVAKQTESAAFALIAVVAHLEELPEFRTGRGTHVLKSLADSMFDLCRGGEPPLLKAASARFNPDRRERRHLKLICSAGVRALMRTGEKATIACEIVASAMSKHGLSGKFGGVLGWSTLYYWYKQSLSTPELNEEIEDFLSDWEQDSTNPMTTALVMQWIKRQAKRSAKRTKAVLTREPSIASARGDQ